MIRTTDEHGRSHGGFQWPREVGAIATCPDWNDRAECGGGLHGLLDGIGDWSLTARDDELWWVLAVRRDEVVIIDDAKCKVPRARVEFFGDEAAAKNLILPHQIKALLARAEGNTATGDSGHAAATGYKGHAAATGENSIAVSIGMFGTAQSAGFLVLAEYEDQHPYSLLDVRAGKIGEGGLKPGVSYRLKGGEFVEAAP